MFKKKVRRNFRARAEESSDEERGEKAGEEADTAPHRAVTQQRRGVSFNSKPSSTPPHTSEIGLSSDKPGKPDRSNESDQSERSGDEEPASAVCKPAEKWSKTSVKSQSLSFTPHSDGAEDCDFKVKRSNNKAVIFQARKREDSPIKETPSQQGVKDVDLKECSESSTGSSAEDIPPDSDSEVKSRSSSSSNSSPRTQTVNIPDAKKIHAAKEQRRRARVQRDYIPLDEDQESTPGSVEREEDSDRERDSDDEPDDHERRIQFAPKSKTLRERMAEKMGESDSVGSGSDSQEDEDQHLWEQQQIGKGVKRHQKHSRDQFKPLRQKKMVEIPETLPPVSLDIIKKRITGKLESLKEVHRAREAELRRMQLDMESAKNTLENLENHAADKQLHFYRSMKIFSQNLLECLSEKMVLINSVELDMHSLYIDLAESLVSQRRQGIQQESTHLQQLTYRTNANTNGETLGKPDTHNDSAHLEDNYGSVPADLEPTTEQEAELQGKRVEILKRSQEIFADVQEDFCDVMKILSKFDEWRFSFPDSYNNAYIGLCLPKLLAPLIRHQLIGWNPLKAEGEDFEALPWYSAVEKFCHGQGYEESENPDNKTLPAIIEKTILPKMQGFVELVWDPLSLQQSRCLTALCQRIEEDYSVFGGEKSKPVKAFIEAVIQRLRSAVDNDVFIPLYPKICLEDKSSPQFQFQNHQFWCAVKLLGNMALWDGLVSESVLQELMLDKLLNRYLMMTLLNESSPKHIIWKCKVVTGCFPKSWFVDLSAGSSLPQLQNFSKHLVQTTHLLCKGNKDATSCRAILSDVMNLLGTIKAFESMETIAQTYNCQDIMESLHKSLFKEKYIFINKK
ncbi:GC-rich sequence DNA-binding factor 2 [Hoplias malabaricus]|uniref:GC-rich sequence DNA-binding factor 2 n=1 Tax=Hoplias malabaricus TaxID=27720 RepID=UPI0034628AC0